MITVLFRCGHQQKVDDKTASPRCVACGEFRIARNLRVRAPRIVGCATGPLVETKALPAIAVSFAPKDTQDAQ